MIYYGDCLEIMSGLEDNSIDAIITDPPYFEIKGDFDFVYTSYAEYLHMMELCAILKYSNCYKN